MPILVKPKVLQLIDSFQQGGSERQAVQLTRLLRESGRYDVQVACLSGEGPLRAEIDRLGLSDIAEYPLKSFYDLNALTQWREFRRFLRNGRIDIVHAHDFYTNIFGTFGAAAAGVPARIASRRETEGLRTPLKRWVERRAFSLADVVLANAEAVRQQVIEEGVPPEKIVTIYNGMDTRRVSPQPVMRRDEALAAFNLPRDVPRRFVTIVANMRHAIKDQATFLRAAKLVRDVVPQAAFVLAGEGELMEELKALTASLGLERDAFFIGRCHRVSELLALSDVCVLSSKGEGFSNSILEYMAAARPVVATDVGGAREAVIDGETGYIVPREDAESLAARITMLLQEPERARAMGIRSLQVVEEKFSCEAQLERTENLYDRLLETVRHPYQRTITAEESK
ncbi:MAG TPA: glycosyltransferase [Pyrinomonadaceae bacterium]|nr:glycosyltransferase [Pyrinomonadaceae bacterium]